jgi:hypothetical protein
LPTPHGTAGWPVVGVVVVVVAAAAAVVGASAAGA